jgi:hypothetical protein
LPTPFPTDGFTPFPTLIERPDNFTPVLIVFGIVIVIAAVVAGALFYLKRIKKQK